MRELKLFEARYLTSCTQCGAAIAQFGDIWGANADFVRNGMGYCNDCAGASPETVKTAEIVDDSDVESSPDVNLDDFTKAELTDIANDAGLDVPRSATKADIIAIIQNELG